MKLNKFETMIYTRTYLLKRKKEVGLLKITSNIELILNQYAGSLHEQIKI